MKNVIVTKAGECTHYCGRANSYKGIGKDLSGLGNPFWMKNESMRDEVCDQYRDYFYTNLKEKTNLEFIKSLARLMVDYSHYKTNNMVMKLGCFCSPKRCHCDTLVEFLEG